MRPRARDGGGGIGKKSEHEETREVRDLYFVNQHQLLNWKYANTHPETPSQRQARVQEAVCNFVSDYTPPSSPLPLQ